MIMVRFNYVFLVVLDVSECVVVIEQVPYVTMLSI